MSVNLPFLVKSTRQPLDSERASLSQGTAPQRALQQSVITYDASGAVRFPAYSIDKTCIPIYPLLQGDSVREFIPRETLSRIIYYCKDGTNTMPNGKQISSDSLDVVKRILQATDPRTEQLAVIFADREGMGRFYAKISRTDQPVYHNLPVGSIVRAARVLKGSVMRRHGYVDIDQVKSHPTIMCAFGAMIGYYTPGLSRYVHQPDQVIQEISDFWSLDASNPLSKGDVKNLISRTVYGGGYKVWMDDVRRGSSPQQFEGLPSFTTTRKNLKQMDQVPDIYRQIQAECADLSTVIFAANPDLVRRDRGDGVDQRKRRTVSYFFQTIENYITYTALDKCVLEGYIPTVVVDGKFTRSFVWGYDGFSWVLPSAYRMDEVITSINDWVHDICGSAFNLVRFADKEIEDYIPEVLDDAHELWQSNDFRCFDGGASEGPRKLTRLEECSFIRKWDEWKAWFEIDHLKIEHPTKFMREIRNQRGNLQELRIMNTTQIRDTYMQYHYLGKHPRTDADELQPSIKRWITDPNLRLYERADPYPPPLQCPPDTFNTWIESPYHDSVIRPGNERPEAIQLFKDMISIVCGHCIPSCLYLLFWIAHAIQCPAHKIGVMPIITGSEGTGKTAFTGWLTQLFGVGRTLDTKLSNIIGDFNSPLVNKFFVIVNELPQNLTEEQNNYLKNVITDESLVINEKHGVQYETISYHRFMGTTNDPPGWSHARRPWYIRAAGDLKRDVDKLNVFLSMFSDTVANAAIYHYLQHLDMEAEFGGRMMDPPRTAINMERRRSHSPFITFGHYLCDTIIPMLSADGVCFITDVNLRDAFVTWATSKSLSSAYTGKSVTDVVGEFGKYSWLPGSISNVDVRDGIEGRVYNKALIVESLSFI